ncbi:MAG: hypothetical protein DRI90_17535 [Deltaproteobacteria bacterium]|nr:MAG: hypothetical protein DRI90_17535 [Deltaproteobacteria bacterium]
MLQENGSCLAAGVPPDRCAAGFEPDGAEGCRAILPSAPCSTPGQVAYLGDTSCHDIAPCGSGTWGQIPTDSATQHVDGSTTEPDADGSAAKPWPTVQQGVDAAAPGAIVAVAEGHYLEEVVIGAPVQLWGRCPTLVTVEGTDGPAIAVGAGGSSTVVRGLAVTGGNHGVMVQGATEVVLQHLWIHDMGRHGIGAGFHASPTELSIREVLVDQLVCSGILLIGAEATIERFVARGSSDNQDSRGVEFQDDVDNGRRSQVNLRAGILEDHGWANVYVIGSDVSIDGSLIRDTAGSEQFGSIYGFGVLGHDSEQSGELPVIAISGSVIEGTHQAGAYFAGGSATIDDTVIRDPRPDIDLYYGRGLVAFTSYYGLVEPAQVVVRGTLIEGASDIAVLVWDSDLTVERTIIRDTKPSALDQSFGVGMYAYSDLPALPRAQATVRGSIIEGSRMAAFMSLGGDVTLDGVVLDATEVDLGFDRYGDGLVVSRNGSIPASAEVTHTLIRQSVRVGISNFGATVTLSNSVLECNAIHLNGETMATEDFSFTDVGGNRCGCGNDEVPCKVLSSELAAPGAVEDPGGL